MVSIEWLFFFWTNFKKIPSDSYHRYQLLSQFPKLHRSSSWSMHYAIQWYAERVSRFRKYQRRRKKAWMAREGEGEGSCIKPLCSKVSRTFSHGDSSRLITNSKASSPTGGNTQPRLFVPVLLPLLRPTFRCFRNEIGPLLSPFPSHRPQTCYCSSLIRNIIIEVSPNPDSSIWK